MEDNYFDDKLKKILQSPPDFEVDEGAIANMHRKLDAENMGRPHRGLMSYIWWLLPLVLLPFLGGGIFLFNKYQNLQEQFEQLTQQVQTVRLDTVTHKHIIYQYDTIYNVIYQEVAVPRYSSAAISSFSNTFSSSVSTNAPNSSSFLSSSFDNRNLPPPTNARNNEQLGFRYARLLAAHHYRQTLSATSNNASRPIFAWDRSPLSGIDYASLLGKQVESETPHLINWEDYEIPPFFDKRSMRVNPAYYFIPQGFNVGLQGNPINVISTNVGNAFGSNFGVSGALAFHNDVALELGVERLGVRFELTDVNNLQNYPLLPANDPVDLFKELKANLTYLQIPILLTKHFRSEADFRPFIGLGIVAQRPWKQDFEYEYISGVNGEYSLTENLTEGEFSINNIRARLGARYYLGKQLSLTGAAQYQYGFNQGVGEYFQLRYWGLNLGMQYHLQ
ncbi:MAG: outer membrane beta-barrel protein [Saprospiraceae bacterium]